MFVVKQLGVAVRCGILLVEVRREYDDSSEVEEGRGKKV